MKNLSYLKLPIYFIISKIIFFSINIMMAYHSILFVFNINAKVHYFIQDIS